MWKFCESSLAMSFGIYTAFNWMNLNKNQNADIIMFWFSFIICSDAATCAYNFSFPLHNIDIIIFIRCLLASEKQVASYSMYFFLTIYALMVKMSCLWTWSMDIMYFQFLNVCTKKCRKKIRNSKKIEMCKSLYE